MAATFDSDPKKSQKVITV
ncbi:unnamed protein product [Arabidopsis thaliana]|uniref:Uncharacterized protein n=1 Tax=Arabidopsis thaliana TaxID=3702 RepID=A0A5S9WMQ7_ARATH|nr:unnamed protein product [Arabidopsis thaliana]VYS49249.1 unnamed protein product [Arabidopsis thaliana]